ncbi:MAG: hypothetical protein IH595_10635 [Bacteroidales bacterium]|nr:hypothetical protein [Bacteroidales bacterium]
MKKTEEKTTEKLLREKDQLKIKVLELEKKLAERTSELQNARNELETFTYSVSHDLRAPLRAIMGFSEIISERYLNSFNEEAIQYFNFIREASENLGSLIDDLLKLSRLLQFKQKKELVDIEIIVNNVLKNLSEEIKEQKATIKLPEYIPSCKTSRFLLEQILHNLLHNALIYHKMDENPVVDISLKKDRKNITVAVKDNGIGIPEMFHEKIFNVFQRLHSQEEFPGTGIGLAIVKKAVEKLEGEVFVSSQPGFGATFTVILPIKNSNDGLE